MNKRTALSAALLAATMAASPAWSQGAGSGAGATNDPGAAGGTSEDNSGKGAQQPGNRAAPDLTRPDSPNATYNGMSAKSLKDANIVNPAGKKVGEIAKVLATNDNKVVAVVVDAGGILGIGGAKVVVPLDQLTLDSKGKQFVAGMDESQLKAMPKWTGQARK